MYHQNYNDGNKRHKGSIKQRSPINNWNGTERRVSYSNRTTLEAIKLSTLRRWNTNGSSSIKCVSVVYSFTPESIYWEFWLAVCNPVERNLPRPVKWMPRINRLGESVCSFNGLFWSLNTT